VFVKDLDSVEDLNKQLDRFHRRIVALEGADSVVLERSAPRNPMTGRIFYDPENGSLNVFNGTSWDVYTKD